MKNKKMFNIMLILLAVILLIGIGILVYISFFNNGDKTQEIKEPSIDEILEQTVDTEELTINLLGSDYVRVQFKLQTDSVKAKEELVKRMFQVRHIIIQELASMKANELRGKEGIQELERIIKMRINELMQEGTIIKVYTTSFILQ